MDDLSGLDWSATTAPPKAPASAQGNYYATFRPTPLISGRSTPSVAQAPSTKPPAKSPLPSKPSTPANDSFANLVSFGGNQVSKNQSLQEKQKALQEQRTKQVWGEQQGIGSAFDIPNEGPWSQNSTSRLFESSIKSPPSYAGTNEYGGPSLSAAINKPFTTLIHPSSHQDAKPASEVKLLSQDDDDLLAAFAADAPIDSSTNYPKPNDAPTVGVGEDDEDDPFGLGVPSKKTGPAHDRLNGSSADDDDVLGLLGRPVSELPSRRPETLEIPSPTEDPSESHPLDKAVAELVEMGFSAEASRNALESTSSGLDVQAAVSIILNQAHDRSRQQTRAPTPHVQSDRQSRARIQRKGSPGQNTAMPAWMRQQGSSASTPQREDSRSPVVGENDPGKYAADLGNNLLKTANSLWKTGTKKLNQAVSDFNSDSDTSQPKWMRDVSPRPRQETPARVAEIKPQQSTKGKPLERGASQSMTDEALLLEARDTRSQLRQQAQAPKRVEHSVIAPVALREHPSAASHLPAQRESHAPRPSLQQPVNGDSRLKLNRQLVEEQSSQAYISPARRKKQVMSQPTPEVDLFDSSQTPALTNRSRPPTTSRQPRDPTASLPKPSPSLRSQRPPRVVPAISPSILKTSTSHRQTGTKLFKAGDYASAATSYTAALAILPSTHPISSLVLTNRALTHLKTGDPKACIADAELAISIIGSSKGSGEMIDLGNGEGNKSMPEIWGKAMTRRAEALEQLEKWSEAATAWRECVQAGVGGGTSVQGRLRCEKAAGTSNPISPKRPTDSRRDPSAPATISRPTSSKPSLRPPSFAARQQSAEAVSRLRALNAAAEKADDEKFALSDSVSARIDGWRKGKETNLRALLGSLDAVLWDGSGWKMVGMSELIVPGKVKVAYMKGIAKVHPDKLPPTATTEQVMISGAVFSTLNEAWDRFKQENGL